MKLFEVLHDLPGMKPAPVQAPSNSTRSWNWNALTNPREAKESSLTTRLLQPLRTGLRFIRRCLRLRRDRGPIFATSPEAQSR